MPQTYDFRAPNGKTYSMPWASPTKPTEQQLDDFVNQIDKPPEPKSEGGLLSTVGENWKKFKENLVPVGKQFGETLAKETPGMLKYMLAVEQARLGAPRNLQNMAGEQAGQFQDEIKKAEQAKGTESFGRYIGAYGGAAGLPITQTAEDIVAGDYGKAALHGGMSILGALGAYHAVRPVVKGAVGAAGDYVRAKSGKIDVSSYPIPEGPKQLPAGPELGKTTRISDSRFIDNKPIIDMQPIAVEDITSPKGTDAPFTGPPTETIDTARGLPPYREEPFVDPNARPKYETNLPDTVPPISTGTNFYAGSEGITRAKGEYKTDLGPTNIIRSQQEFVPVTDADNNLKAVQAIGGQELTPDMGPYTAGVPGYMPPTGESYTPGLEQNQIVRVPPITAAEYGTELGRPANYGSEQNLPQRNVPQGPIQLPPSNLAPVQPIAPKPLSQTELMNAEIVKRQLEDRRAQKLKAEDEQNRIEQQQQKPEISRAEPAKRSLNNIIEDIGHNLQFNDEAGHERLRNEGESLISREHDPEVIIDNFNNLEQELQHAKRGNPDFAEAINFLRDTALDRVNKAGLRSSIKTSYDKGYYPSEARGPKTGGKNIIDLGQRTIPIEHYEEYADRIKQLEKQRDAAYKEGNTKIASRIGSDIQELDQIMNTSRRRSDYGGLSRSENRNWPSDRWQGIVDELDAENAPDHKYRDILSTGGKDNLKRGETWRSRVLNYIRMDRERRTQLENESSKTSEMRVPGPVNPDTGRPNIVMGGADERVLDILGTALYTRDRPSTVAKELLQNSVDERKISGNKDPIRIAFHNGAKNPQTGKDSRSIIVQDSGRGMGANDLYTIFSDVGKTGKGGETDASGGFGFAKAAPLLSGDYVKVESITIENGKKVKYTFEGNPKELKKQTTGVPLKSESVPSSTRTGFKVEVFFPREKYLSDAEKLVNETVESSPEIRDVHTLSSYGQSDINDFLSGTKNTNVSREMKILGGKPIPPKVDSIATPGADVDVHYELDDKERRMGKIVFLNNGLYTSADNLYYGNNPSPGLPPKVVLNIKPTVEEGSDDYPFGANRENINRELLAKIDEWINKNIKDPASDARINELQKTFDSLQPAKGNNFVTLDSGNRYTPAELHSLENNPSIREISNVMGNIIKTLEPLFEKDALGKTEKYGMLIGKDNLGGINIPSPKDSGKYAILINPFSAVIHAANPKEAAQRMVHIIVHEYNHNIERNEGGGYTWSLANVLSKWSLEDQINAKQAIFKAITDSKGNYAPKFQELLQEYKDSRGRPESTTDILSRERESEYLTGDRQEGITRSGEPDGERTPVNLPHDIAPDIKQENEPVLGGTSPVFKPVGSITDRLQRLKENEQGAVGRNIGIGRIKPKKPKREMTKGEKIAIELANIPRALQASLDFSAPLRQGAATISNKAFWTSLKPMLQSFFDEKHYEKSNEKIENHPDHALAVGSGVKFTDLKTINTREEAYQSHWTETLTTFGILPERHSFVKMSGRAYTAFLNETRMGVFSELLNYTKDGRRNPEKAKAIADVVNNITGRGKLGPENWQPMLNAFLFSPRLIGSRIKILNPWTYVNPKTPAVVRIQYLRSLAALIAAGTLVSGVAKMFGHDVNLDPSNSDFGKIKLGNQTRVEVVPGGLEQYVRVFNQVMMPQSLGGGYKTSPVTGRTTDLLLGKYGSPTQLTQAAGFVRNKLSPIPSFFVDWKSGTDFKGQPIDWHSKNISDNPILSRISPISLQDASQLAMYENPKLYPLMVPSLLGLGVQTYSPQPFRTHRKGSLRRVPKIR